MRKALAVALLGLLPACVNAPKIYAPAPMPPAASSPAFRAPVVQRETGLDAIMGQQAGALIRRFGKARIDLTEGDARKLQYASERCVLDIYLYPLSQGAAPVATHVEARLREGGASTDKSACLKEIARR